MTIIIVNILKTTISNSFLTATFNKKGAELTALNSKVKNYIWNGNVEFWDKHAPVLFPIVGTLKNNCYIYDNKAYYLSRHGFARDLDFEIVSKTNDSILFSLKNNEQTLLSYPFEFELQIAYVLIKKQLKVSYKVQNFSNKIMPFSIGGHPAFALNEGFKNYSLAFEKNEKPSYFLLENNLISEKSTVLELINRQLNLNYNLFENDALVFKSIESEFITILENSKPFLKFSFRGFPNFGIWSKQNAPFICLEPWFGYSDTVKSGSDFLEKEGIQILKPNEIFESLYEIEIL